MFVDAHSAARASGFKSHFKTKNFVQSWLKSLKKQNKNKEGCSSVLETDAQHDRKWNENSGSLIYAVTFNLRARDEIIAEIMRKTSQVWSRDGKMDNHRQSKKLIDKASLSKKNPTVQNEIKDTAKNLHLLLRL